MMHAMKRGLFILGMMLVLGGAAYMFVLRGGGANVEPPPRPEAALVIDDEILRSIDATHEAASADPGNAQARATLAMVYDAAHMYSLAETTYLQAIALDGDDAEWWYHVGRVRESQGDVDGALEAIDRAAELAPGEFIIHVRKGVWLLENGEAAQADEAFRKALELKQDSLAARLGLARALVTQDQHAAAVPILEQLRSALPADSTVRQMLGRCYMRMNRPNDGAAEMALGVRSKWDWTIEDAWLENVLKMRTGYRFRLERAVSALHAGASAQAAQQLEKLRAENPGDVPVTVALAKAYADSRQFDQAISVLLSTDRVNPDHFAVKLNIGYCYQLKGDLARAMHYTNEAINLHPDLAAGRVQKARLLLAQNQVEAAHAAADEAIRCDASDVQARYIKAQALLLTNRIVEAEAILEQATRSHPHLAQGFALLAAARVSAGKRAEAMAALAQAERLDPNDPTVQFVRAEMQRQNATSPAPGGR
jgi:predicted Zn-dependent protease